MIIVIMIMIVIILVIIIVIVTIINLHVHYMCTYVCAHTLLVCTPSFYIYKPFRAYGVTWKRLARRCQAWKRIVWPCATETWGWTVTCHSCSIPLLRVWNGLWNRVWNAMACRWPPITKILQPSFIARPICVTVWRRKTHLHMSLLANDMFCVVEVMVIITPCRRNDNLS